MEAPARMQPEKLADCGDVRTRVTGEAVPPHEEWMAAHGRGMDARAWGL
ncbi:MAG: hypothetical protein ACR2HN_13645 [Tepidiformaceae bacterium]